MKTDVLKDKQGLVTTVLLAIAAISALLSLVKVAGFFVTSTKAEGAVKQALTRSQPDAENLTAQIDRFRQVAEGLKKNNLFAPPAPKENPIKAVMGIFGNEALINGQWYKVGTRVGDAKILAIGADSVTTEWQGRQSTFYPIDSGSSGPGTPSSPERRSSSTRGTRPPQRSRSAPSQVVIRERPASKAVSGQVTRDTFRQLGAGLGVSLSSRMQDNLMRYWNGLSDQQKAQAKERWNRMSDRQRRQTLENAQRGMR